MFIEPTIIWVPSRFSGYIWLDTKIVLKKRKIFNLSFFTNSFGLNYKVCDLFFPLQLALPFDTWNLILHVWLALLESWSAHDIVLELFLMCSYIISHVHLYVLLRSLLFLKRTRSLPFFIPFSHICYIYAIFSVNWDAHVTVSCECIPSIIRSTSCAVYRRLILRLISTIEYNISIVLWACWHKNAYVGMEYRRLNRDKFQHSGSWPIRASVNIN